MTRFLNISTNLQHVHYAVVTFTPRNLVNLFIVYESDTWPYDVNGDFTLNDCLFRSVKLTENADPDKFSYFINLLFSFPDFN